MSSLQASQASQHKQEGKMKPHAPLEDRGNYCKTHHQLGKTIEGESIEKTETTLIWQQQITRSHVTKAEDSVGAAPR